VTVLLPDEGVEEPGREDPLLGHDRQRVRHVAGTPIDNEPSRPSISRSTHGGTSSSHGPPSSRQRPLRPHGPAAAARRARSPRSLPHPARRRACGRRLSRPSAAPADGLVHPRLLRPPRPATSASRSARSRGCALLRGGGDDRWENIGPTQKMSDTSRGHCSRRRCRRGILEQRCRRTRLARPPLRHGRRRLREERDRLVRHLCSRPRDDRRAGGAILPTSGVVGGALRLAAAVRAAAAALCRPTHQEARGSSSRSTLMAMS
jgi:hypothetical protein